MGKFFSVYKQNYLAPEVIIKIFRKEERMRNTVIYHFEQENNILYINFIVNSKILGSLSKTYRCPMFLFFEMFVWVVLYNISLKFLARVLPDSYLLVCCSLYLYSVPSRPVLFFIFCLSYLFNIW